MTAKYVVGIDLGTTNGVAAYAALDADQPDVQVLSIPQLVAANTVESRPNLPSFVYLAPSHAIDGAALELPWSEGRDFAVGEYARRQAAEATASRWESTRAPTWPRSLRYG